MPVKIAILLTFITFKIISFLNFTITQALLTPCHIISFTNFMITQSLLTLRVSHQFTHHPHPMLLKIYNLNACLRHFVKKFVNHPSYAITPPLALHVRSQSFINFLCISNRRRCYVTALRCSLVSSLKRARVREPCQSRAPPSAPPSLPPDFI